MDLVTQCSHMVYMEYQGGKRVFDIAKTNWDHELYQLKLRLGFWMK